LDPGHNERLGERNRKSPHYHPIQIEDEVSILGLIIPDGFTKGE